MASSAIVQQLVEHGTKLFADRLSLMTHWQELAELFYYERADFTSPLAIGDDYASGSMSSVAALARREMGNMFRTMLRPHDFFAIKATDKRLADENADWLEWATKLTRSVMYRRGAGFTRSTDAGDHDFVTFGQNVLEVAATPDRDALFYRSWHLRDVAWSEDYAGNVYDIHRQCKPTLSQLVTLFKDKVPERLREEARTEPNKVVKLRHVVGKIDGRELGIPKRADHQFFSLWVLVDDFVTLELITRSYRGYVIPRANTVSGSQYARSPFTSIILPDARTKQSIERILLEAGEKAVDPPMIATQDAIRSDIGLYAGGVTYVDIEYDERLGEVLRPISQDRNGLPFGQDMSDRYDMVIRDGMMLNKISLPDTSGMTAYQIRKIIEQHMRAHIPMFEPVEVEYNEPLCAETFAVMRSLGAFPPNEIPETLRGADVDFEFKSPVKDLEEDGKTEAFAQGAQALQALLALDPTVQAIPNTMVIARDILKGSGWPAAWLRDEKMVAQAVQAAAQQQQAQQAQQQAMMVAEGAGKAAPMVKAVTEAQAA